MDGFGEMVSAAMHSDATVTRGSGTEESCSAEGRYHVSCIGADGAVKWSDDFDNLVTTAGKNLALDAFLAGAAYTVVGPFLGLISSTSFTAVASADVMTSHAGWLEAGIANAPTYSSGRKTAAWSAATTGSKAFSAAASFTMTGAGTVQGAFLVLGTGAVNTGDSTTGTLYSAGAFSAGSKTVASGDVLNVSYTASL